MVLGICYLFFWFIYNFVEIQFFPTNPTSVPADMMRRTFALVLLVLYWVLFRTKISDILKATILVGPMGIIFTTSILAFYEEPAWAIVVTGVLAAVSTFLLYKYKKPWFYYYAIAITILASIALAWPEVPISVTPAHIPSQTAVPANITDENLTIGTSHNVIIDTDMAIDDWMAILYLLHREDVNVRAITVTGAGEAHCDAGVQNALGLITLAQHAPIPVACRPEIPLQGNHAFPQVWRDFVDGLAGQNLSASVNPGAGIDAIKLLTQTIQSSPERITLLTLGPLTNIASALQATPTLTNQIAGVNVMGGAVYVPGNLEWNVTENTTAEWNIYIDPHAANVVFASGVPVTLVSLDATNQARLTMDFLQELKANQKTNATKFIYSVLNQIQDSIRSNNYYFWDPLSAGILVDNNLATYQQSSICVVEAEGPESGRTEVKDGCPQLKVAVSVDASRFEQVFLDTLNSQPALATVNLSSLKGTWSGTSNNGNLDMQVTITLTGTCKTGLPCGTFNFATQPCSGEYVFIYITDDNRYEFAEINKQGVCGYGQEFFQLQADGTLLFKSIGDYGINSGFLNKTTP